jgi:hypothetical protein
MMISMNAAKPPETRPIIWKVTGQVLVPNTLPVVVLAKIMNSTPASTSTPK